jgi:DNA (cytosine-5)-methyltransferase 1
MTIRSGELFAGVGGLGMAVDEVFGSTPAWFAEFDAAPSKVLAHRYPDVPNFGDVTKLIDPPKVDILAGGFPCQDVSLAGARRGMKNGTRSGLWSEYARIIDEVRPDWVVIENVRGLISARADSEVEPCPWCVGDGDDEYHLRALDAVLADLAALGFDAEWTGLRAADIGAPHGRYRFFILAWPAAYTRGDEPERWGGYRDVARSAGTGEGDREERERNGDAARNSGAASSLSLLPTPGAYDGERGGSQHPDKRRDGGHSVTLQDVTEHLMPTPRASRGASATEIAYALGGERTDDARTQGQVLLPTPQTADGMGGHLNRSGARSDERLLPGAALDSRDDWGPYSAAVTRWERVIGRIAPSPTKNDAKGGKARLNAELPEWMMGWPDGWVTDPAIGLTRAEQLKACGNGVVPQQAAAALRELLARQGVPHIRKEAS